MKCHFVVGQKVVGVPKKGGLTEREIRMRDAAVRAGVILPKVGEVYTVRDVYVAVRSTGESVLCIRLAEITNDSKMTYAGGLTGEIGFDAACFQPVIERKTDISVFKAMLTPSKEQVSA